MGQAESAADQDAIAKELFDLFGFSRSRDVEIFRFFIQQKIADAASDEKRGVSIRAHSAHDGRADPHRD